MENLYLFISGRNPELSKAEIYSFLKTREISIIQIIEKENAILIEVKKEIDVADLTCLGGTIAVGKVLADISKSGIKEIDAKLKNAYRGKKNNILYAIWNFSDEKNYEFVVDYLKEKFKEEKLKASRKNLTGTLELQDGKRKSIVGNDVDEQFFVFDKYFGRIFFNTNYEELEFRDISKPHRREFLAISPRLAKIMINLSQTKKGGRIIDAFCGIGVIISEALLQGINATGIDVDKNALEMAKKNLEWLKIKKEGYELINENSGNVKLSGLSFNSLVSEPDLGEILKEIPTKEKARLILIKYENLMINVLKNMKHYVNSRFVFTSPYIMAGSKRISCDINKIAKSCGLRVVESYPEFRKNQIVGREIFVMEH